MRLPDGSLVARPQLSWRSEAEQEYFAAVAWYAESSGDILANRFVDAVSDASDRIVNFPNIGSRFYAEQTQITNLLCRRTGRFPYLVFYIAHEDRIEIVRLLHERRDIPEALA